jgi:large subunit ribosomal protein L25
MRNEITVVAEPRETRGKNEARRLRTRGLAPAIIYGPGTDPQAVAISPKDVNRILRSATGQNTLFNVQSNGVTSLVMIVEWQRHPLRENILHVDMKRIDPTKPLLAKVHVQTSGEPRGVKEQGGLFELLKRQIEIECLPDYIPDMFRVDVSEMMLGDNLRAGQIPMPESIKLVTNPETIVAHVVAIRVVAEPTEVAAEAVAPATAEPEVIKKGKKEEEGAAGAEEKKEKKEKEKKK